MKEDDLMTVKEARQIADNFHRCEKRDESDIFIYTEAMEYLIREEKKPQDMLNLGGWYYGQRNFDLALKYYNMAASYDYEPAWECLGYVWYYGRTGEKDYEKAFEFFSKCMEKGNHVAAYKIADMYKNGYYVEKDYEKYKQIVRDLYDKVKNDRMLFDPVPEVFTRLARIEKEEGNIDFAVDLMLRAKNFLGQRIQYSDFFGNLNIMKWLIDDLYETIHFDPTDFDFFDLYYALKTPGTITFMYGTKEYSVNVIEEDGECVINFNGKWFRNRDDFFAKAEIDGNLLTSINNKLYLFKKVK